MPLVLLCVTLDLQETSIPTTYNLIAKALAEILKISLYLHTYIESSQFTNPRGTLCKLFGIQLL